LEAHRSVEMDGRKKDEDIQSIVLYDLPGNEEMDFG